MNNKKITTLGVGACVAACAGTALLPALAGAGLLGASGLGLGAWLGGISFDAIICGGALLLAGGGAAFWYLRKPQIPAIICATDKSCSCGSSKQGV